MSAITYQAKHACLRPTVTPTYSLRCGVCDQCKRAGFFKHRAGA